MKITFDEILELIGNILMCVGFIDIVSRLT